MELVNNVMELVNNFLELVLETSSTMELVNNVMELVNNFLELVFKNFRNGACKQFFGACKQCALARKTVANGQRSGGAFKDGCTGVADQRGVAL